MSFRTVDGTATTGDSDYLAKTGTLTRPSASPDLLPASVSSTGVSDRITLHNTWCAPARECPCQERSWGWEVSGSPRTF